MIWYQYKCQEHGEFELEKNEEPKCPECSKLMKRVYVAIKQLDAPTGAYKGGK